VSGALAVAVRLGLLLLGWPDTNSDEATMGLMAAHMARGVDHPLFFYGQSYLGSGEAWAASALYALTGPSLIALRLPLVAAYAVFLLAMWQLGVLIALPVVIGAVAPALGAARRGRVTGGIAVAAMVALLAFDTATAYRQALTLARSDPEQSALVTGLLDRGTTLVWTDYWTCDRIAFESRERIVCGSLDDLDCLRLGATRTEFGAELYFAGRERRHSGRMRYLTPGKVHLRSERGTDAASRRFCRIAATSNGPNDVAAVSRRTAKDTCDPLAQQTRLAGCPGPATPRPPR
jgi:hypothetical protein